MYLFIELSSIIIFAYYLRHAISCKRLGLLLYAAFFAFLFENASIMLFASQPGGYYYHSGFKLFVWGTPLFIILLWSAIIYSTYAILNSIVGKRTFLYSAPLYILALDLVLDQVATKLGFWTWIGFEQYEGIFSVPASNYIGWTMLPFFFYLYYEKFRGTKWMILQPFLSYLSFIVFSLPLHLLKINFFDKNAYAQYLILSLIVIAFAFLASHKFERKSDADKKNPALFLVRIYLHLFSIIGLIRFGDMALILLFIPIALFESWVLAKYMGINRGLFR